MADASTLSVALAHHWMMSMRGGEKTLTALAELFPEAPIYTLCARRDRLDDELARKRIRTSWLQPLAWLPDLQRKALPLLPLAVRSLDATKHDVVLCSDAAIIKAIRTRPDALKICYCHSPMRYVWDLYSEYYQRAGALGRLGLRVCAPHLRRVDRRAAQTVTAFIANSRCVADRIRRSYGRPALVIPPPVDTDFPESPAEPDPFYLVVAEQVSYKRTDLAIDACNRMNRSLIVIGTGPELDRMRRRAGPSVRLLGWQDDSVVRDHMRRCRALLFCGEEDFGMVPVEAQAAGRPVIAYRAGGALDSVLEGQTGVFFDRQDTESVIDAIRRFESMDSLRPPAQIQEHARRFSRDAFLRRIEQFYKRCLETYRAGGCAAVARMMDDL